MDFDLLIATVRERLTAGDIPGARDALDSARELIGFSTYRSKTAHDVANEIQRDIFGEYLGQSSRMQSPTTRGAK